MSTSLLLCCIVLDQLVKSYRLLSEEKIIDDEEEILPRGHNHLDSTWMLTRFTRNAFYQLTVSFSFIFVLTLCYPISPVYHLSEAIEESAGMCERVSF